MATPTIPTPGDLIVVGPGGTQISPGVYVLIGGSAANGYTVTSADNPRQNHAGTVPQSRIISVFRAA